VQVVWVLPLSENGYPPDCASPTRDVFLPLKTAIMKTPTITPAIIHSQERESEVKRLRISNLLTQSELAELAGVTQQHVDLYERGLPVPLDSRRRILKVLWATKSKE
jgi:DNA-binding transcriptional regulator YiaG